MIDFSDGFAEYAKQEYGLEDPFHQEIKESRTIGVYTHRPDGSTLIDSSKSLQLHKKYRKAKEQWIQLRNKYTANRILREAGYEALLRSHYREYIKDPIPCEGADGQCHMDCPHFNKDCPK